jgi:hypothetical protein
VVRAFWWHFSLRFERHYRTSVDLVRASRGLRGRMGGSLPRPCRRSCDLGGGQEAGEHADAVGVGVGVAIVDLA